MLVRMITSFRKIVVLKKKVPPYFSFFKEKTMNTQHSRPNKRFLNVWSGLLSFIIPVSQSECTS